MTIVKSAVSLFVGVSFLFTPCAKSQSTVAFDFDTGATPVLSIGQSLPLDQTAGGVTARFTTTAGASFSIQSDISTGWKMSRFAGKYLSQSGTTTRVLTIAFNQRLTEISATFATSDLEIEKPSTIQLTAYLDSTSLKSVGAAAVKGTYSATDSMPSGVISFNANGQPFNLVEITIPFATGAATAFVVDNIRVTPQTPLTGAITSHVSAASYATGGPLAPASIASIFGQGLTTGTAAATSVALPTTLGDTTLTVKDAAGAQRPAPLYYVGPTQINYVVPEGTAAGVAEVTITSGLKVTAFGTMIVEPVAPGLFTANADGKGAPAATAIAVAPNQTQTFQDVARCGAAPGSCVPSPIDLGPAGTQVVLALYGTGIRGRSANAPSGLTVKIGGLDAPVLYAGPQSQYAGLDQVNVSVPAALAGRGEVDVVLTVDSRPANTVRVNFR